MADDNNLVVTGLKTTASRAVTALAPRNHAVEVVSRVDNYAGHYLG